MPSRSAPADDLDLYDRAVAGMERRVARADTPAGMLAALRWGMEQMDQAYARTPARVRATVACRAGCAACCSVPVDVQAHEVFLAADHLQRHRSPEELAALLTRLAAHRQRMAGLDEVARAASRSPCVLLAEGSCSIYAARPEACRAHHARDAAVCGAYRDDPAVDLRRAYVPVLRDRMFAVMLGLDEAIEAAGFDDRAYDFGCALFEALTDPQCLSRWMDRQPAFPDSCLAAS